MRTLHFLSLIVDRQMRDLTKSDSWIKTGERGRNLHRMSDSNGYEPRMKMHMDLPTRYRVCCARQPKPPEEKSCMK